MTTKEFLARWILEWGVEPVHKEDLYAGWYSAKDMPSVYEDRFDLLIEEGIEKLEYKLTPAALDFIKGEDDGV